MNLEAKNLTIAQFRNHKECLNIPDLADPPNLIIVFFQLYPASPKMIIKILS